MSLVIKVLFHFFYAQHVSDINTSIVRGLRLFHCITTMVVWSCFDVCWSFGVAGLGRYPCSKLTQRFSLPHGYHPNASHTETRPHDQCGDTMEKSQAPDDGCINVRNMLWQRTTVSNGNLEVCHPRCVCKNWKGYVVKHNYVN